MSKSKIGILVILLLVLTPLFSQGIDLDEVNAQEDFRWGVIAYNRANYNDAIRSFERALSLRPDNLLYQEWLGNALFRSGFVSAAEEVWAAVLQRKSDPLLSSRLEIQQLRSGLGQELFRPDKYIVVGILDGAGEEGRLFLRPSSVFPLPDGGFLAAAFGSNEILSFDVNGAIRDRYTGGLNKLASPFDMLRTPEGAVFISEYNGNRIARTDDRGLSYERFGSRGRGEGQFLGPQYMALDEAGYLYITDIGNRRVTKMDQQGRFILSFGDRRQGRFPGLKEPTGIAVQGSRIYVADALAGVIQVFDTSGNYLSTLAEGLLSRPEGLSSGAPGELILADDNKIYSFDIGMEQVSVLADLSRATAKVLKAVRDRNGNILAADFNSSRISFLSDVSQVYTGLSVRIDRITTENFPRVMVDLAVEDPLGNPIVGLNERNFIITELSDRRHSPDSHKLLFRGNLSGALHGALVVDRDPSMASRADDIRGTVTSLAAQFSGTSSFRVVSGSQVPLVSAPSGSALPTLIRAAQGEPADRTTAGRLDLAVRLAAGEIISGRGHKAIFYLTDGKLGPDAFAGYSLLDLTRYLQANGIRFYVLSFVPEDRIAPELTYLAEETGAGAVFLFRPQGLQGFFDQVVSVPDGTYTLEYNSLVDGDFGRLYIPFQAEVILYNRSGREKSGYFAPARY